MIKTRFLSCLLLISSLSVGSLEAQRNKPATRPATTGANILPNGSLELPLPSGTATAPAVPSDYPRQFIPTSPDDVFFEDEEEQEGGIGENILNDAEEKGIEYTPEQLARFKTFVNDYVAYLKQQNSFIKGRIQGWWMYPAQSTVSSNSFTRFSEGAQDGQAALRLSGVFSVDHQLYTYPDPLPVRSKAKYLVSYHYRGNYPKSADGYARSAQKLAVVRITWIPKAGKALALKGVELAPAGKSWIDSRDNSNTHAPEGFFNMLIGMDLKGNEPQWREKDMVVEAPENAEKMTFELAFFKNEDGGIANYDLQVDNLSMKLIQGEEGEPDVPPVTFTTPQAPKKVRQRYTQREFAIEWTDEDPAVEGFEIEAVAMQGRTTLSTQTYTTKEKRYFFEGMTPGVTYRIRLRSKKGTAFSDYSAPLEVETSQLGDFSGGTIPFLYTIEEDGSCPQKLPLYFLELTNPNALITCYIDGQEVKPEGRILTFPSLGTHALSITVQESEDKIWDLEYQVTVK